MTNFPINGPTACRLKWGWSTIFLSKEATTSCHRVTPDQINVDNFKHFHNLYRKRMDRQKMIDGEWPGGGCEYCQRIETAGGISDRQIHLTKEFDHWTPPALLDNNAALSVNPTVLEVYFNNTCNLKCLYCGPWFSSKWQSEIDHFGPIWEDKPHPWQMNPNYDQMVAELWKWMELNHHDLRAFHILGGEPFMQKELDDCLDFFDSHPNPLMAFVIVTNLSVSDAVLDRYIAKFEQLVSKRKIKQLQITASLDCWGPQQEYVRSGLNLAQWQRNFKKLLQLDWINLQINHAISALTIKTLPELLDNISVWNERHRIYSNFMTVQDPTYLNPDIMGPGVFTQDFEIIQNKILKSSSWHVSVSKYMKGIGLQIENAEPNVNEIKRLKDFLERVDRRRNSDYKQLFPWLAQVFDKYE
jgi:Radical SAM superfamily